MKALSIFPLAGIDNASRDDAALQVGGDSRRTYLRDAVNVDISELGHARMRAGLRKLTEEPVENLWQSPLHGDVFCTASGQWCRLEEKQFDRLQPLATIGRGPVSHLVLNNVVLAAGAEGIFQFNGQSGQRFTLDTPPAPLVSDSADGSLVPGSYGVAISWLRGSMESSVSAMARCDVGLNGALAVTVPMCLDSSVTHVRLYVTRPDGTELGLVEQYPVDVAQVALPLLPSHGAAPQFQHLEPMPTGTYFDLWRGRLLTAKANVLRFSEALAYHLHDPRHGFLLMPQRITFVKAVDGGIWVGQVDHVAFLSGASPADLTLNRKASQAPIPGSALHVPAEVVGPELAGGGAGVVVWLARNGYVVGTASGAIGEMNAGRLANIPGTNATSIVLGKRLTTAVT